MQMHASTGCVLMASGLSTRFGSNKLLTPFGPGREPMLRRAFAATDTPLLASRVVVARSPEVETLCREVRVPCLLHALPGRNDTVRLGLEALLAERPDLAGCMFLPGDQPLLRRESVESLLRAFAEHLQTQKETERAIFRLGARAAHGPDTVVGSPVLFEKGLFQELLTLPQGMGGSVLLRKYPAHVHTVYIADRNELADADTPEALAQLEALARQKL